MFSEEELLECFKRNVDNEGWIYFVGTPESNTKFIIDDILSHRTKSCMNCAHCKGNNFYCDIYAEGCDFGEKFVPRNK